MKLVPLETTSRSAAGCKFGLTVHQSGGKKGKHKTLHISIHPDVIRKMKTKEGDIFRLDGDAREKVIRLTPVMVAGKAARPLRLSASGRGDWKIPYTGLVAEVIPFLDSMVDCQILEITSEGPLVKLP